MANIRIRCPRCGLTHDSLHALDGEMRGYCSSCVIDTAEHFTPLEESKGIPTNEEMYEVWREDLNDPYGLDLPMDETSINDLMLEDIDDDNRNNQ